MDAEGEISYSVVIPTFRRPDSLHRLLKSLESVGAPQPEKVVVVNNDSNPCEVASTLKLDGLHVVEYGGGANLAGARNVGWRETRSPFVLFIDDDNVIEPDAPAAMLELMEDPSVGVACPLIVDGAGSRIWCGGIQRSRVGLRVRFVRAGAEPGGKVRRWATDEMPDAFMVRRDTLTGIGGFDDERFPFHMDEADFGERTRRAGWRLVGSDSAVVRHFNDVSGNVGAEWLRAQQQHGDRRVQLMSRSRFVFRRLYQNPFERIVCLAVIDPLWFGYVAMSVGMTRAAWSVQVRIWKNIIYGFMEAWQVRVRV